MYFRRTKKLQGEVSLNEAIETDGDGAELSIGDVVGKSDTMLEDLQDKDGRWPPPIISAEAMSPASRRRRWKSWRRRCGNTGKRHTT